jgi:hypothetical protein
MIDLLLRRNASVNCIDPRGANALILAASGFDDTTAVKIMDLEVHTDLVVEASYS